ncbi:MAG: S9 family peptidase [Bacteroidales bacterium]|jgi:oligopeptidase B|nr:S9 family peptidase [Bacteroidales bacterium]
MINSQNTAPMAKKEPKLLTTHGIVRQDDYFWLNQRDTQEVLEYLNAENAYAGEMMKDTEDLQKQLFDEIKSRIKEDDQSVPFFRREYWYYTRYETGKEYPIYCRKFQTLENSEEIILDVNQLAEGHAFCAVSEIAISDDNNMLAFAVDFVSRRIYDIWFKNLETGEILNEKIEKTSGNFTWTADNKTLFYVKQNRQLRSCRVMRYTLGNPENEQEIFFEKDAKFNVGVGRTKSENYVFMFSGSSTSSEYRIIPANQPEAEFQMFQHREKDLEYSIEHFEDHFFVMTNWNATNFKLMKTPKRLTNKENWKDIIPHRDDVKLEDFEVFSDYLVLEERKNALNHIRIISLKNGEDYYLEFPEEVYNTGIGYNPDFYATQLRYGYNSMTTPRTAYEYNLKTRETIVLKQQEVLDKNFKPENYESKRLWAVSHDGERVPISMVYRKGLQKNGQNPTLLYGYGSYGISIDPNFSSARLSLLDRGFVYAIAHIRGGEEMGRKWYEDAKFCKKKNTFLDFIACAKTLIQEKFTSPQKLAGMGGSAGGLLIGAVANMQPDLFHTLIAQVPFVDVVTTMLDEDIPLTTGEYEEWGNPNEKEFFDYMLSYSPYDNVKPQNYPNILITTGYHDSQVQYWEPAKWVAKLRATKTDNNLLLFKTEMNFGHGGASGRFESLKETALEYAFLLKTIGGKG